jgi:hypothetical protein
MRRLILIAMLAVGLVGTVSATPALAGARTIVHSTNFAGYTASSVTSVTSFSGSLSSPTLTCPATGQFTIQPEVRVTSPTHQASVSAYEVLSCSNGSAFGGQFDASVTNAAGKSAFAGLQVAPGDSLRFKMTESDAGVATILVSNVTAGTTATAAANGVGGLTEITVGTTLNSPAPTPIPSFTPITFGGLRIGASTLSAFTTTESEIFNGIVLQVSTSAISANGGVVNRFVHT